MRDPAILWPPHAYRPGQNARHPETFFDAVKGSVLPGLSVDELAVGEAFRHARAFLDAGFFWEAHEVLEPVWMALPDGSTERRFVQGLIQFANASLKLEMGWPKAAARLAAICGDLLPGHGTVMRMDVADVRNRLTALSVKIKQYNA